MPKSVKFDKSVKIKQKLTSSVASFKFNQSPFVLCLGGLKKPQSIKPSPSKSLNSKLKMYNYPKFLNKE